MQVSWVDDIGTKVGITNTQPQQTVFKDSHGGWRLLGKTTKEQLSWHKWLIENGYDHGKTTVATNRVHPLLS